MSSDNNRNSVRRWQSIRRRRMLAAVAGVTVGSVAGCTSVTNQEFDAQPVRLPEDAQGNLVVAETARDSSTTTREVDAVDGEVTITSHTAAYSREKVYDLEGADYVPQPSLLGRYLGQVNDTNGPGSAVVATASDVGLDGVDLDVGWNVYQFSGNKVSVVAPAGLRGTGTDSSGGWPFLLGWMAEDASPTGESNTDRRPITYAVDATEFVSGLMYGLGRTYDPIDRGWALDSDPMDRGWASAYDPMDRGWALEYDPIDRGWAKEFLSEGTVLIALDPALTPEEVFGISAEEMPGERIEAGDSFDDENPSMVAAVGGVAIGGQSPFTLDDLSTAGVPAPTVNATFGASVLSTPSASVAGHEANPLVEVDAEELLADERVFGHLIGPNRLQETGTVEWLTGPDDISDKVGTEAIFADPYIGQKSRLRSFIGVVDGDNGPWGVGIHVARVESDGDAIIAGGGHRTPVFSPDAGYNHLENHFFSPDAGYNHLENHPWFMQGAALTVATLEGLERM